MSTATAAIWQSVTIGLLAVLPQPGGQPSPTKIPGGSGPIRPIGQVWAHQHAEAISRALADRP